MQTVAPILIIAVPVIIVITIVLLLVRKERKLQAEQLAQAKHHQEAEARAIWACAIVEMVGSGSGYEGTGKTAINLQLKITGQGGKEYSVPARWLVDLVQLPNIQPGVQLSVKVDTDDPTIIYPHMPGMHYLGKE